MGQEKRASSSDRENLSWILEKKNFTEWIVKHWKRLPREVVKSWLLKIIKRYVDVVLKGGLGSAMLMAGLDGLKGLF